jgi:hypothetical protein
MLLGVYFDFEDGAKKKAHIEKRKNQKGKMEILFNCYIINKGISVSVFNYSMANNHFTNKKK